MPADIVFTPPHISHMTPRTLRAANAVLYATSTLLVIATVIYCAFYKQMASSPIPYGNGGASKSVADIVCKYIENNSLI